MVRQSPGVLASAPSTRLRLGGPCAVHTAVRENDDKAEFCRKCGEGAIATPALTGVVLRRRPPRARPPQVSAAYDEWDPARRYAEPRPISAFVPPARYPTHLSWIITIIFLGIPATAIHAVLFYRGVYYPYNLGMAVVVVMLCCLPLSLVACSSSGLVRAKHRSGDDARAYRYSRTTGLLCWISLLAALSSLRDPLLEADVQRRRVLDPLRLSGDGSAGLSPLRRCDQRLTTGSAAPAA